MRIKQYSTDYMRTYVHPCVVNTLVTTSNHLKPEPKVLPMELLAPVCKKLGVRFRDIKGKSRKQEIVLARHIGVLMLYYCYDFSMQEIGKILKKDHTIVITARKILRNSFDTGHKYSQIVEKVAPELLPVLKKDVSRLVARSMESLYLTGIQIKHPLVPVQVQN